MTVTVTTAETGGTSDPRPEVRIAAVLRSAMMVGAIPPGTLLHQTDIAPRFHAPAKAAVKAFSVLRGEQLVIWRKGRWYAAPGGPPNPDTDARLGATLARLRKAIGKTPDELADTIPSRNLGIRVYVFADDVRAAEEGAWQPRHFWEGCDAALGADGTLLRLHDNSYDSARADDGVGPDVGSRHDGIEDYLPPSPPPAPPGLHPQVARVAGEIAARVRDGHWPPGTHLPTQRTLAAEHSTNSAFVCQAMMELAGQGILVRTPYGYFAPGPLDLPALTVVAVVLEWSDGTRTRLVCAPAHHQ